MVGQTKETSGGAFVDSTITLKTGETYDVRWHIVKRGSALQGPGSRDHRLRDDLVPQYAVPELYL